MGSRLASDCWQSRAGTGELARTGRRTDNTALHMDSPAQINRFEFRQNFGAEILIIYLPATFEHYQLLLL